MNKEERRKKQLARLAEMKSYENELNKKGFMCVAGVDEVGRGPLAGPVVAAAVILPRDYKTPGIDDSKKLSPKKRAELDAVIKKEALAWGIGSVDHERIDEINILNATKEAMKEALKEADAMLYQRTGKRVDHILIDAVSLENIQRPQTAIIKGDSKSVSIAAASVIAKVYRDALMVGYSKIYRGYSFESNKGYGTKAHYEGLKKQGPCPIHRRTFLKNL